MSNASPPAVVAARAGDLPELEAHLAAAGLPSIGLADALAHALLVRDGDAIVASAALEPYGRDALLRSVAVRDVNRGTGVGRAVVGDAIDLARQRGHRRVYLLTETAAGWFPRFGFRPIARSQLPPAIARSPEASEACSETAVAMVLELAVGSAR